ncbi:cytochrome c oxidase assembly protein [Glaciecola petra]|uniref:Cytochrome c oxidase assembly protein CtaG n=1 Tax=Glaciecola petra TaxID=3075602 RepID=A0ABU2ZRV6_9ALTE|nr:cytochrome c oxidase assembly protein [Aestuariibacter sp. P117]MDT0595131.1 cytochrome c oxidase assembly protein [Aestuariibacter sp. P117]
MTNQKIDISSANEQESGLNNQTLVREQPNHSKTVGKILLAVVGMFGFGFALVPLYDVFCDITGINGKTSNEAAVYEAVEVDTSRMITVDFITRTNSGMPWEFEAQTQQVKVHPGKMSEVAFYVRNPTKRDIIAQAVPSVSPGTASLYMNKTECFCFQHQPLKAGEEAIMPMVFYIDPQLPEDITFFTLQYTLYDITESAQPADVVAMN